MSKKRAEIIKYIFYVLIVLIIYALQGSAFFSIYPRKITVNFLPFFLTSAAIFEPRMQAAVFSVFIGVLADAASISADGLMIAYCLLAGLIISFISEKYFQKILPICMLLGSAVLLIQHIPAYIFYSKAAYGTDILKFLQAVLPEIFISAALFIPLFFIIKGIHNKFTVLDQE